MGGVGDLSTFLRGAILIILGIFFAIYLTLLSHEGCAVLAGIFSLLVKLLFLGSGPMGLSVWASMTLVLAWKHRANLSQKPRLRSLLSHK